ncbi:class I adenylate-forming enzyme family protein [Kitasatospora cineracea]|uniref:Acyl-CoA synthetase (AMP-forming)/AMP-acid ligase II n=1 Tax=Kitasatospora cineracea TaxID=88074 RepID=A0A3N4RYJ6_9ACTN|nr:class I adenylate-forming enzyme family protein [Kitasatospora cineracea]RPE29164.1 acyl-CoA synthetase (AMP-forming)/AMP-acid ligase II [Kitasatospora cineracea]
MTLTPTPVRGGTVAADWVDEQLLAGPDGEPCLRFGAPVNRGTLRALVAERQRQLAAAGLGEHGTAALRMPPSAEFVAVLLAVWRSGARAVLLDHRLTAVEVDRAVDRLHPRVLVELADDRPRFTPLPDADEAPAEHALVQLSSGSTGPSKVIARTAADLLRELDCYARLPEFPTRGERTVLLSSTVHVLGLVGGLLHALHAGVELVVPQRATPTGILAAIAEGGAPTTVIGVPFHAELLAAVAAPPELPQLRRMVVAGELVRPQLPAAFRARYGVPLGTMYGMTETGVIATDLSGRHHPAVAPVHGMRLSLAGGELHIAREHSPYLGPTDPTRWSDGLLHTRDAALIEDGTGLVTVLGRRDSQISIGGLKVDLNEVEQALTGLPGVVEAVVLFADGAIEAYAATAGGVTSAPSERGGPAEQLRELLGKELAGYKLPRRLHLMPRLPRTATGKLLRDFAALRRQADAAR